MPMTLSISSHDELIAYIPHALGFSPESSMVCLAIGGGPTARLDLPGRHERVESWVEQLAEVYLSRHHPERVALVAFGQNGQACVDALVALGTELSEATEGPTVGPVLWVDGDEWTDVLAGNRGSVPTSVRTRMDAEFALRGRAMPSRTRSDLAASVQGDVGPVAERLEHAQGRLRSLNNRSLATEAAWVEAWIDEFIHTREYLSDDHATRLLVAIQQERNRDLAAAAISYTDAALHAELWHNITRRAPIETRDASATLLALSSFLEGNGARAWVALDLIEKPDAMAGQLVDAIQHAVDPRDWARQDPRRRGFSVQQAALQIEPEGLSNGRHARHRAQGQGRAVPDR